MNQKCAINSIYRATEGEGVLVGTPQVFVRFQGCNIGCLNCDSKDTWEFRDDSLMSVENVMTEVSKAAGKIKRVSITGGDPLHPKLVPGTLALARELKRKDFFVSLEASGSRIVDELFDIIDFINFDFKTPSTGVKTSLNLVEKLVNHYPTRYQIKSVIADTKDFDYVMSAYEKINRPNLNWVLTPCYEPNEEFPLERFLKVVELNEVAGGPFRVIGQQHKWLHGPSKKNI